MTTRSDEGPVLDDGGVEDGALLLDGHGVEVRESTWAGAYYCAHVLWVTNKLARAPSTTIAKDSAGDPLIGFLHVPADAETSGQPGRPPVERHAHTTRIVACALRGIVDEHKAGDVRVLLTGFGPFAAVISNPTGDFVDDDASMRRLLTLAVGAEVQKHDAIVDGGARIERHTAKHLEVGCLRLDVDDNALDPAHTGSLPWALARFQPHAVLALGVHRASTIYRVEIEPTNAGLKDGDAPRHERGRPLDVRAGHNRALARAIVAGARILGV